MKRPRTPWPMGSTNFGPSIDISCLPGGYLGQGGDIEPPTIPSYAVVNRDGSYILNRDGSYLVADPTPRTSA